LVWHFTLDFNVLFAHGGKIMAKCDYCGKGVTFGIKVSHSHRRSNRTWKPNVQRVKAIVAGTPKHVYACTRCLRSGKVQRSV
jgi:large subunit ribosomal protein L28